MHVFISLPVLSEPTCLLPSYVLSENMCSLLTLWHLRTYVFITSISFLKVRIHEAPCVISGHMSSLLFHCYFRTHVINIHSMIFQKQRVKYSMFFQNLRIHYSHYFFFRTYTCSILSLSSFWTYVFVIHTAFLQKESTCAFVSLCAFRTDVFIILLCVFWSYAFITPTMFFPSLRVFF